MKGYSIDDPIVKELAEEYQMTLEETQKFMNDTLIYNEVSLITCMDCKIINCEQCCDKWDVNFNNVILE